ncbi:MAG: hypothetical protein K1060chlam5_01296, partial [Candidatus Anoxychlamydiales bacterium]|nr:hypothetical protein [Candidatus Anoxychlamydiales bacterium]
NSSILLPEDLVATKDFIDRGVKSGVKLESLEFEIVSELSKIGMKSETYKPTEVELGFIGDKDQKCERILRETKIEKETSGKRHSPILGMDISDEK